MTIGERLRELREQRGIPRKELSEASGVSESAIKQYENGLRAPKTEQLAKLVAPLGTTLNYVLTGELLDPGIEDIKNAIHKTAYVKGRMMAAWQSLVSVVTKSFEFNARTDKWELLGFAESLTLTTEELGKFNDLFWKEIPEAIDCAIWRTAKTARNLIRDEDRKKRTIHTDEWGTDKERALRGGDPDVQQEG